jgi:hypothetical protein
MKPFSFTLITALALSQIGCSSSSPSVGELAVYGAARTAYSLKQLVTPIEQQRQSWHKSSLIYEEDRKQVAWIGMYIQEYGKPTWSELLAKQPNAKLEDGGILGNFIWSGDSPRPVSVYFKWKVLATHEIKELTVNLDERLPKDINKMGLIFELRATGPVIYLRGKRQDNEKLPYNVRPKDWPIVGPIEHQYTKNYRIYPDFYPEKPPLD